MSESVIDFWDADDAGIGLFVHVSLEGGFRHPHIGAILDSNLIVVFDALVT